MATLEIVKKLFKEAAELAGKKPLSSGAIESWAGSIKSVSDDQLEDVFWPCFWGNGQQWPKPSEILMAAAQVVPRDDWEAILAVSSGRLESATISGYSAAALRGIGGLKAVAETVAIERLHKDWFSRLEGLDMNGLPAAAEEIRLVPARPPAVDGFVADDTGEFRANALINLLRKGTITPEFAKKMANSGYKVGDARIASSIPPAQRDRVLAAIAELNAELITG